MAQANAGAFLRLISQGLRAWALFFLTGAPLSRMTYSL